MSLLEVPQLPPAAISAAEDGLWVSSQDVQSQVRDEQGLASPSQGLTSCQLLLQSCLTVALTTLRGCPPVRFSKCRL